MPHKRFYKVCHSENIQRETPEAPLNYSLRFNQYLTVCSSAESVSVSIEQFKIQNYKLYLQTVEKVSYVPISPPQFPQHSTVFQNRAAKCLIMIIGQFV